MVLFLICFVFSRTSVPEKALEELLPQLRPVVFWMANCLQMLPYLQCNMSRYIKDPSQMAENGDDSLLNADEELLMFLEEVIIYTFQQTVYHLTKACLAVFLASLQFRSQMISKCGRNKDSVQGRQVCH